MRLQPLNRFGRWGVFQQPVRPCLFNSIARHQPFIMELTKGREKIFIEKHFALFRQTWQRIRPLLRACVITRVFKRTFQYIKRFPAGLPKISAKVHLPCLSHKSALVDSWGIRPVGRSQVEFLQLHRAPCLAAPKRGQRRRVRVSRLSPVG